MTRFSFLMIALLAASQLTLMIQAREVINPVGEDDLGSLIVNEPAWKNEDEKKCGAYSLSYRDESIIAGKKQRFAVGKGQLTLKTGDQTQKMEVAIEKGITTGIDLSAFVVAIKRGAGTNFDIDFGPRPKLKVYRESFFIADETSSGGWSGYSAGGNLVLPGNFIFTFSDSDLPSTRTSISPGEVKYVKLNPPDQRATLIINPPSRQFPNPEVKNASPVRGFILVRNTKKETNKIWEPNAKVVEDRVKYRVWDSINDFKSVPALRTEKYQVIPFRSRSDEQFEYVVNNIKQVLELKTGKTTEINLKRIDVNDVKLTDANGEETYTRGEYTITRTDESGKELDAVGIPYYADSNFFGVYLKTQFPTKTGMDVLPGRYKIKITYGAKESKKTLERTIDLTK